MIHFSFIIRVKPHVICSRVVSVYEAVVEGQIAWQCALHLFLELSNFGGERISLALIAGVFILYASVAAHQPTEKCWRTYIYLRLSFWYLSCVTYRCARHGFPNKTKLGTSHQSSGRDCNADNIAFDSVAEQNLWFK